MATLERKLEELSLLWAGDASIDVLAMVDALIVDAHAGKPLATKASVLTRCLASRASSPGGSSGSPRSPLPLASPSVGGESGSRRREGFGARAAAAGGSLKVHTGVSAPSTKEEVVIPRFFNRALEISAERARDDLERVAVRVAALATERSVLTVDSTLWVESGLGVELSGLSSWVQPQLFVQMVRWIEEEQRGGRPLSPPAAVRMEDGDDDATALKKAAQLRFSMLLCRKVGQRDLLRFWAREVAPYDQAERLFRALHAASFYRGAGRGGIASLRHTLSDAVSPSTSSPPRSPLDAAASEAQQAPARIERAVRERSRRAAIAQLSLGHEDLEPIVQRVLERHPGLAFLSGATEFQSKYVATVVQRILFETSDSGKRRRFDRCQLKQLRASLLQRTLALLDDNDEDGAGRDINLERRFWSYEHFYVLYTHFWELDSDKDGRLSRNDLLRYGANALTPLAVDRVFLCWVKDSEVGMDYGEWIAFLTCEVDKTTPQALRYWHAVLDIDGTGVIRPNEIEEFWEQQSGRLRSRGMDLHAFDDLMCQFSDMIKEIHDGPVSQCAITVSDLSANAENASKLFNRLFNLNRYLELEQHDPFAALEEKLAMGGTSLSRWDRWAEEEYRRFAAEENGAGSAGGADGGGGAWSDEGDGFGAEGDGTWVGWGDDDDDDLGDVLRESSSGAEARAGGGDQLHSESGGARAFSRDFHLSDDEGPGLSGSGASSKSSREGGVTSSDESMDDLDWARATVDNRYSRRRGGRGGASAKQSDGNASFDSSEGTEEELVEEGDPFRTSSRRR